MLLLLGLLLLCDSVAPCPLVDVTVCDNPYCIGFRTGATFSEMIHSRLAASKQLPGWRAFYATEHGKAVVQALAETNCAMYERQHSELASPKAKRLLLAAPQFTFVAITNAKQHGALNAAQRSKREAAATAFAPTTKAGSAQPR